MKSATKIIAGAAVAASAALSGIGAVPALAATFDASANAGTVKIQQVDDPVNHWERTCVPLGPKSGVRCTPWQVMPGPCPPGRSIWVCRPVS